MKKLLLGLGVLAAMALSACNPTPVAYVNTDPCSTARNIYECQQVAQAGGNVNDYLMYGLAGYTLGYMNNGAGYRQPIIIVDNSYRGVRRTIPSYVNSRTYVSTYKARPSYTTSPSYSRPSPTRPSSQLYGSKPTAAPAPSRPSSSSSWWGSSSSSSSRPSSSSSYSSRPSSSSSSYSSRSSSSSSRPSSRR